ncbi:ABC1 kinase family protein [Roseivirga sp. BDSF3-8]|uniref:ABC1 kinase family protein n=1 Tax=Roseivirga sp. BDSF3-8 TaxID=3241598 RepID=UPI003531AB69
MKEQSRIPTGKVQRAARFVRTGAKVGGNYLKYYTKKAFNPEHGREELDSDNAEDIYDSLSELKGSALKVAQMMAMDKNLLPGAYQQRFQMAQYSAPPLSYPLVVKTFQKYFGDSPTKLFDTFTKNAVNAASMGQVHQATMDGKTLAVKIQYPGVGDSVKSDLKLVRPFALRLLNINEKELDRYMEEVEEKLLEETDYELELRRSIEISEACGHIESLFFPKYYQDLSSERVITMDWLEGMHLKEFLQTNPSQEVRNSIGQALWDFYHHQIHNLRKVHADPHPGNFLMREDGTLGIIDFGCIKVIPEFFYDRYFALISKDMLSEGGTDDINKIFEELEFLVPEDTPEDRKIFTSIFKEMIGLLGKPFHSDTFDFSDDAYFKQIFELGERISNMQEVRKNKNARGSRHGLYINRTYFGLYNILNDLKANITTTKPEWLEATPA